MLKVWFILVAMFVETFLLLLVEYCGNLNASRILWKLGGNSYAKKQTKKKKTADCQHHFIVNNIFSTASACSAP